MIPCSEVELQQRVNSLQLVVGSLYIFPGQTQKPAESDYCEYEISSFSTSKVLTKIAKVFTVQTLQSDTPSFM